MKAWVTLLTQPNYLLGVRALGVSLRRAGSAYPLVVMVTADIDDDRRQVLTDDGLLVRSVDPIRPADDSTDAYANARFAEVWTKLAVWGLTEFEQVVFLDADMLVTQNMDELLDLELSDGRIAACHACRCNPNQIASYPADWTPAHCAYTYAETGDQAPEHYLNGGLLVLRPDQRNYAGLLAELATVDDLSRYPFAEQDFLNEHFDGRWQPLPYVYNALKTLPFQHPLLWDGTAVKNLHYIIDKPWQRDLDTGDRYYDLHQIWWDIAGEALANRTGA